MTGREADRDLAKGRGRVRGTRSGPGAMIYPASELSGPFSWGVPLGKCLFHGVSWGAPVFWALYGKACYRKRPCAGCGRGLLEDSLGEVIEDLARGARWEGVEEEFVAEVDCLEGGDGGVWV